MQVCIVFLGDERSVISRSGGSNIIGQPQRIIAQCIVELLYHRGIRPMEINADHLDPITTVGSGILFQKCFDRFQGAVMRSDFKDIEVGGGQGSRFIGAIIDPHIHHLQSKKRNRQPWPERALRQHQQNNRNNTKTCRQQQRHFCVAGLVLEQGQSDSQSKPRDNCQQ